MFSSSLCCSWVLISYIYIYPHRYPLPRVSPCSPHIIKNEHSLFPSQIYVLWVGSKILLKVLNMSELFVHAPGFSRIACCLTFCLPDRHFVYNYLGFLIEYMCRSIYHCCCYVLSWGDSAHSAYNPKRGI